VRIQINKNDGAASDDSTDWTAGSNDWQALASDHDAAAVFSLSVLVRQNGRRATL
jgi:hypothetical protein